ncbi:MAG: toxin TcdB middle/N-terminal domain-containing protein, partial [Gallionella sp.]|nr:toxin TcdB middle/N-terminal domain-containing protein [Gallionella sp.]
ESYSKIISYGSNSYGPTSFKVWTKSGQIIEFGNTADSAIEAQGKTAIRVWAVNKVGDTKGNYLTVGYTEDTANGEYYPKEIDYTGNTKVTPALLTYNSVRFIYATRPDITPMYDGGSLIKSTQRLTNVQTWAQVSGVDTLVKDYQLTYDVSAATQFIQDSRLIQIQECDSSAISVCLPATSFGLHPLSSDLVVPSYEGAVLPNAINGYWSYHSQPQYMQSGDFNGDGKMDYMWIPNNSDGRWLVAYSTGNGFTTPVYSSPAIPATISGYLAYHSQPQYMKFADFNGDGKMDYMWIPNNSDGRWLVAYSTSNVMLISSITTGLNAITTIDYKPLTNSTVYTKDNNAVYPLVDIQAPMYVVSSVSSSNGIGGNYVSNYNYVGAKSHMTGGGFLGFRQTINTDAQGIKSTTTYRQDYPYQGLPLTAEKRTSSGVLLNSVANTWTATTNPAWSPQYHASQIGQSVESSYELTGGLISTVTTSNVYDGYGNPTSITVSTPDGYSKTTTNTYVNDLANWYLGRLINATVSSTAP